MDRQRQSNETNAGTASRENQEAANNKFMKGKVFNDPIHGHIELHAVCVRIIDTPQFQRLRHIKQLDACYLVYPGASHNRFEHSLGTCFLAGKLMRKLRERQSEVNITERDILCVEIAGLCHDLGQGPFSHVFEKKFMPKMRKDFETEFTHEETAKLMFEYMLEDNGGQLKKDIQAIIGKCNEHVHDFKKFDEKDFLFIKEMIDKPKNIEGADWPYQGRDESKSFMYEIVANKRNGIDVDKWDYLARDSYMLGMKVNFDHRRCFMSARVITANGAHETDGINRRTESSVDNGNSETTDTTDTNGNNGESARGNVPVARKQICYREKDAQDFYDMFYTRITLHRRAYQHKTHKIIGLMICDALVAANDTVKFIGKNGKKYRISEAVNDMKAYTQLTDDIFQLILYSQAQPEVLQSSDMESSSASSTAPAQKNDEGNRENIQRFKDAKEILNNILKRNLYKCVLQTQVQVGNFDEQSFKEDVITPLSPVKEKSLDFDVARLDYGMKDKDPMAKVSFYRKDNCDTPIKLEKNQVSYVLPDTFAEYIVRIYSKIENTDAETEPLISKLKKYFVEWCIKKSVPLPKGLSQQSQNRPELLATTEQDSQQSSTGSGLDTSQTSEQWSVGQIPEASVPGADDQEGPSSDVTMNIYVRQSEDNMY